MSRLMRVPAHDPDFSATAEYPHNPDMRIVRRALEAASCLDFFTAPLMRCAVRTHPHNRTHLYKGVPCCALPRLKDGGRDPETQCSGGALATSALFEGATVPRDPASRTPAEVPHALPEGAPGGLRRASKNAFGETNRSGSR